jgi:hypothetical protein
MARGSELDRQVGLCWGVRQFSEAGRHGDNEAAGRREQPAQVDEGLAALVGGRVFTTWSAMMQSNV